MRTCAASRSQGPFCSGLLPKAEAERIAWSRALAKLLPCGWRGRCGHWGSLQRQARSMFLGGTRWQTRRTAFLTALKRGVQAQRARLRGGYPTGLIGRAAYRTKTGVGCSVSLLDLLQNGGEHNHIHDGWVLQKVNLLGRAAHIS